MLHVFSRLLGYWLTALALVAVVVDGAKSIAASSLATTSLGDAWRAVGPGADPSAIQAAAPASAGWIAAGLDQVVPWLLTTPVAAAAGLLGILFLAAGRKRRRYSLSREFAA